MNFEIRNSETREVYGHVRTLTDARNFCRQRLLKLSADRSSAEGRQEHLSNLAAGLITVYDARHTNYTHAGF
nr:hypothetical protein 44 [bacterium]